MLVACKSSTEPASTEPASTEPAPTEPASTEPASTKPASPPPTNQCPGGCPPPAVTPPRDRADATGLPCHRAVLHRQETFSLVVSFRAIGGSSYGPGSVAATMENRLLPLLDRCVANAGPTSVYAKPHTTTISFSLGADGRPRDLATPGKDLLSTCALDAVGATFPASAMGPAESNMSIEIAFYAHDVWPAVARRRPTPVKAFPSLRAVLDGKYRDFPAAPIPSKRNPVTRNRLLLDVSEGGGYACCERPTFYAWFDPAEGLVWIRTYQASMRDVSDHWYGPFAL
jgi:hypothetical protein